MTESDYPEEELSSESDNESVVNVRGGNESSDEDEDHIDGAAEDNTPPRKRKRGRKETNPLGEGWSQTFTPVNTDFLGGEMGPKNIPDNINNNSTPIDYLNIFLNEDFWHMLCQQTNLRAQQTKLNKPNAYYAKSYKAVDTKEMKAFLGLRLQMETSVIKPRYEHYWKGSGKNFVASTPGFREVMERDRFLALWSFLHLVDETDPDLDKTDKIYKIRPMLDIILPKFREHYNVGQHLSLDEGMIPLKNRLAIKQYIKLKPVKWGVKSFLLCDSNTGYICNAEIYTGKKRDENFVDILGATGNVVVDLIKGAGVADLRHMIVMDRFYSGVNLFDHLYDKMGTLAVGTIMTNHSCYPKDLKKTKKTLPDRGQSEYMCRNNLSGVVWNDNKPINFLSSYHNPTDMGSEDRKSKDGTVKNIKCPVLVSDYNKYMGGCDKNDQISRLNRTRRHYKWPRRLFVKFMYWTLYNAYVIMNHYSPHKANGKRYRTFNMFLDELCLQLIGDYRTLAVRRESRELDVPTRMQNVGLHYPERPSEATGNNVCVVCSYKFNQFQRTNQPKSKKDCPYKQKKTTFWCAYCRRYLCIREGSSCWNDWHNKVEYWR
ncbi:hypothetical protein SNE40_015314 [Patella caerulea]|uniref:PiggyBac transposable element-derived protein domain-containing protein n=1 Tax=Patella caerulea TaxID=87958 RepID=A0AAN8JKV6_PATCE